MALTVDTMTGTNFTLSSRAARGVKILTGSWSAPSTYVADGITVNVATLGFSEILFANFVGTENEVQYDYSTDKLLFYYVSATATNAVETQLGSDSVITNSPGYFVLIGR